MDRLARAERLAEDFVRPVGYDLVGIGVRRRPGPGLEDVDDKVFVELPFLDLLGGLLNRVGHRGLEEAELSVDECGGAFNLRERSNQATRHAQIADREVLPSSLRAGPVVRVARDGHFTHRIALHSRVLSGHANSS
jgi:hypothetical protein